MEKLWRNELVNALSLDTWGKGRDNTEIYTIFDNQVADLRKKVKQLEIIEKSALEHIEKLTEKNMAYHRRVQELEKGGGIIRLKKYTSCTAPIGDYCSKHNCIHTAKTKKVQNE